MSDKKTEPTSKYITISRRQSKRILEKYLTIHEIIKTMPRDKTFAIAGRLLGDIGECVLAYAFELELTTKLKAGYDAIKKDDKGNIEKKVEIKVRTSTGNIHISSSSIKNAQKGCWLLAAIIDPEHKQIKIVANGKLKRNTKTNKKGFIGQKKLQGYCNQNDKLELVHKQVGGWTITEGEEE